jgi:hypothetical protein
MAWVRKSQWNIVKQRIGYMLIGVQWYVADGNPSVRDPAAMDLKGDWAIGLGLPFWVISYRRRSVWESEVEEYPCPTPSAHKR